MDLDYEQIFSSLSDSEEAVKPHKEIFQILFNESDRGCVLTAVAFLDEALEKLLRAKFEIDPRIVKNAVEPLFSTMGPLSSFYSRAKLAYALGLIDHNIHDILEIIRNLRNKFAHQCGPAQLTDPQVNNLLDKLPSQSSGFAVALSEVMKDEVKELESVENALSISPVILGRFSARRIQFMVCVAVVRAKIESTAEKLNQHYS